jgi:hypothetical protein
MLIIRSLAMALVKRQNGIQTEDCFSNLEVFVANGVAGEKDEELFKLFEESVESHLISKNVNKKTEKNIENKTMEKIVENSTKKVENNEVTEEKEEEDIVTLPNWRLINGAILRNTQQIAPVSELAEILQDRQSWQKIEQQSPSGKLILSKYSSFEDFLEKKADFLKHLEPRAGSGLFVLGNSMNHSCRPNCVIMSSFSDFEIRVVALRKIHKDEELTFSYIDESQPFHSRQQQLMERYLFRCTCERCKEESGQ